MRNNQFLSLVILLSIANAQGSELVRKGSDYFRADPGAVWYIDGRTPEGQILSMYRRYSIPEHMPATSTQIPVTMETYLYGRLVNIVIEVYRIRPNGAVECEKALRNGRFHTYDSPNVYLPAEMQVGRQWSSKEQSGDVLQMRIEAFFEELELPNGLVTKDAVKIRKDVLDDAGELFGSVYEYYGRDIGHVGCQFVEGHWFEILRDD